MAEKTATEEQDEERKYAEVYEFLASKSYPEDSSKSWPAGHQTTCKRLPNH